METITFSLISWGWCSIIIGCFKTFWFVASGASGAVMFGFFHYLQPSAARKVTIIVGGLHAPRSRAVLPECAIRQLRQCIYFPALGLL